MLASQTAALNDAYPLRRSQGLCLAVAAIIASTAFAELSSDLDKSTNP